MAHSFFAQQGRPRADSGAREPAPARQQVPQQAMRAAPYAAGRGPPGHAFQHPLGGALSTRPLTQPYGVAPGRASIDKGPAPLFGACGQRPRNDDRLPKTEHWLEPGPPAEATDPLVSEKGAEPSALEKVWFALTGMPNNRSCMASSQYEQGSSRRTSRASNERRHRRPEQDIRERWRDPRVMVVALFLACLAILLIFLAVPRGGAPGPRPGPRPTVRPPGPRSWLMCTGPGQCGWPQLRRWTHRPVDLARRLLDLSSVAGVPDSVYKPIYEHWNAFPPSFNGQGVPLAGISDFLRELLSSDPFETGDQVPFVDFRPPGFGKVVAISQRQLAFLVANALLGNSIEGGDGLTAAITKCSGTPGKHGFLYSLLSFLAILSKELIAGSHGTMLIGATPRARDDSWRRHLTERTLDEPLVCLSQGGGLADCGLADFMAGGTPHQALTDIAGGVVGGGAQLCEIANSQDESLVQFYSEALAFAFFVPPGQMLPTPFALVGARRYVRDITGQSMEGGSCGIIQDRDWLNWDIQKKMVSISMKGKEHQMAAGAFIAVASACSACLAGSMCTQKDNVNSLCDTQRRHLDDDLGLWYQAYEPTMYEGIASDALRIVVHRIGTGPWGAGLWYGDPQQYFLAVWLATSLLGGVARTPPPKLDYYIYDRFCENPGNQCFVLGAQGCRECVARSRVPWWQGANVSRCGRLGLRDMVARYKGLPAQALYAALRVVPGPPSQVFDLLASA